MKKFFSLFLFCLTCTPINAEEMVAVDFRLTKMSIPAKDTIDKIDSEVKFAFNYGEQAVLDREQEFKAVFQVDDVNGKPELQLHLFDYNSEDELFEIGNIKLNTSWQTESEFTWWHKSIKYTVVLTPSKYSA